ALGVPPAGGCLPALTGEQSEDAPLAGAEPGDLRRMPGAPLGDRRLERAAVAHLGEALRRDQLLRVAGRAAELRDEALRRVAGDRPALDQLHEPGELRRRDGPVADHELAVELLV